jgi:S1-C subfamily serine protease
MTRWLALVLTVVVGASVAAAQSSGVLHIKVSVLDRNRQPTPVPHHGLLISEDPPSTVPRRVATGADGTVDVTLRPGRYVVESDKPITFEGRVYQWTGHVTVPATGGTSLDLNTSNADAAAPGSSGTLETDPAFLLNKWSGSVVGVWTPLAHSSGVVVDAANGLIATSVYGAIALTDAEVQLAPETKVPARVLGADAKSHVVILQMHPSVAAAIPPLSPDCATAAPPIASGQDIVALVAPPLAATDLVLGAVERSEARAIVADLRVRPDSAGGPVFVDGRFVGITSAATETDVRDRRWASRVARVDAVCSVLADARRKMAEGAAPEPTRLPVDPPRAVSSDVLKPIVSRRAGSLGPPRASFADFDVAFITPVHTYGAEASSVGGTRQRVGASIVDLGSPALRPVRDFANWSEYVSEYLPVLLIRATPKLAEGFWTSVARGAAQTQGVALPSMKRAKASFKRLRALCGDREVTPIHPFVLEQRLSESEVILEGLYVFDPGALGPECGTVTLTVFGDDAQKGDTRQIDPSIIQALSREFAALR